MLCRPRLLASLLGLSFPLIHELVAGVLLTDSYKFAEWQLMQEEGPNWDSYAKAQALAKLLWVENEMFSPRVIELASSVAHESLVEMEVLCDLFDDGLGLLDFDVARLIAHYVDDISIDHNWVIERSGSSNVLTYRTLERNAGNPTYTRLNEEGRVRLRETAAAAGYPNMFTRGETTYEAQNRVGRRVESVLAILLRRRHGWFESLDLPVIIDNQLRAEINRIHKLRFGEAVG